VDRQPSHDSKGTTKKVGNVHINNVSCDNPDIRQHRCLSFIIERSLGWAEGHVVEDLNQRGE
jgi:hypothetical protein